MFDYHRLLSKTSLECVQHALSFYERECNLSRSLLHVDQVLQQSTISDEQALFEYLCRLYELFPNPPYRNPLDDERKRNQIQDFERRAAVLLQWIRDTIADCSRRDDLLNASVSELRTKQEALRSLRNRQLPERLEEKQRLIALEKEAWKWAGQLGIKLDAQYSAEHIDLLWTRMLRVLQEREQAIGRALTEATRLEALAQSVRDEIARVDAALDALQVRIDCEVQRIRPSANRTETIDLDRFAIDQITEEIKSLGDRIKRLFSDCQTLREAQYAAAPELLREVQRLHDKWSALHRRYQIEVLQALAELRAAALRRPATEDELIAAHAEFRLLVECLRWVAQRLQQVQAAGYGEDAITVKIELDSHRVLQREVNAYQSNVSTCERNAALFTDHAREVYDRLLGQLQQDYAELLVMCNQRSGRLESLLDLVQSCADECTWADERADTELRRDWAALSVAHALDTLLPAVRAQVQRVASQLAGKRTLEQQLKTKANDMLTSNHPAARTIRAHIDLLDERFEWLHVLVQTCSPTHGRDATRAAEFDARAEKLQLWLQKVRSRLDEEFVASGQPPVERCEHLLAELGLLKNEIESKRDDLEQIETEAASLVPMVARSRRLSEERPVTALATVQRKAYRLTASSTYTLTDNSDLLGWRVRDTTSKLLQVESALLSLVAPDTGAVDRLKKLQSAYAALVDLWAERNHQLRVALIGATLRVLHGWDYDTYVSMQPTEIEAILGALEDDVEKLAREAPSDDADTRRLQDDLRALKRKFAEFDERRRRESAANAQAARIARFVAAGNDLLQLLREKERELLARCAAPIPSSLDALQSLSSEFSEFEFSVKRLEARVEQSRSQFTELGISASGSSGSAGQLQDTINELWSWLLKQLALYADRLRDLRPALGALQQSQKSLQQIETKLNAFGSSESDSLIGVERLAADLRDAETAAAQQQSQSSQLQQTVQRAATAVLKTRRTEHSNSDVQRLENDATAVTARTQRLVEVLQSLGSRLQSFANDVRRVQQELSTLADDRALDSVYTADEQLLSEQVAALQRLERNRLPEVADQSSRLQTNAEQLHSLLRPLFEYTRIERVASELLQQVRQIQQQLSDLKRAISERLQQAQAALQAAQQLHESCRQLQALLQRLDEQLQPLETHVALEPEALADQLRALHALRNMLHDGDRQLDDCKNSANRLIELCGERVRSELKSTTESLESQLMQIRARFSKAEAQLNAALDIARDMAQLLQELLDQLEQWEEEASRLSKPGVDVETIRNQLHQLRALRERVISERPKLERFQNVAQRLLQLPAEPAARVPVRESVKEVTERHSALLEQIALCEQRLEAELQRLGQWTQLLQELLQWLAAARQQLAGISTDLADVPVLIEQQRRLQQLQQQVQAHQPSVDKLNSSASGALNNSDLNDLNRRWTQLCDELNDKSQRVQQQLERVQRLQSDLAELLEWIAELDGQLGSNKPLAALPETARAQLDEFNVLYEQIERRAGRVQQSIRAAEQALREVSDTGCRDLRASLHQLITRWDALRVRATDRKNKLEAALEDAKELRQQLDQFGNWLHRALDSLRNAAPVSRLLDPLVEQLDEHKRLQDDLPARREQMLALDRRCAQLRHLCDKRDASALQQETAALSESWQRLVDACAARAAELDAAYRQSREFFDIFDELSAWVDDALRAQAQLQPAGEESAARLQQLLQKQKDLQRLTASKQALYERTQRLGSALQRAAPADEQPQIRELLDDLRERWQRLQEQAMEQQRVLEEALLLAGQLREAIRALLTWTEQELQRLDGDRQLYGDLDTVQQLIERQRRFDAQLLAKQRSAKLIADSAEKLLASSQAEEAPLLQRQLATVQQRLAQIAQVCEQRNETLADALKLAERLDRMVHELLDWLSGAEKRLRTQAAESQNEQDAAALQRSLAVQRSFESEMDQRRPLRDQCVELIADLLRRCHPDAISPLNHWHTIVQSRWDEVNSWSRRSAAKLAELVAAAEHVQQLTDQLSEWLMESERTLLQRNTVEQSRSETSDSSDWQRLLTEHQSFIEQMSAKQPSVERVLRFGCPRRAGGSSPLPTLTSSVGSSGTLGRTSSKRVILTESIEREYRNEQTRQLADKWRTVWIMAMERLRALQKRLDDSESTALIVKSRIRPSESNNPNFDFDQWRMRLLDHCRSAQLKPVDFFRRLDVDNEGALPVQQFAERCLASDFRCSRVELENAARQLDRNGDRLVDAQEFVETVGSFKLGDVARSEHEVIMDEINKQLVKCSCIGRFRVYHVGEGKYRVSKH